MGKRRPEEEKYVDIGLVTIILLGLVSCGLLFAAYEIGLKRGKGEREHVPPPVAVQCPPCPTVGGEELRQVCGAALLPPAQAQTEPSASPTPDLRPTATPTVSPTATTRAGSQWFVRVATMPELREAEALSGRIKAAGFRVALQVGEEKGELRYIVVVGPEDDQGEAEKTLATLKQRRLVPLGEGVIVQGR